MTLLIEPDGDRTVDVTDASEEVRLRAAGYREVGIDPRDTASTVEVVKAFLAEHPEQTELVLRLERAGQNRVTLTGDDSGPADQTITGEGIPSEEASGDATVMVGDHANEAAAAQGAALPGDANGDGVPDDVRPEVEVPARAIEGEKAFDPSEHKVAEVQAHLAEHPDDAERVIDLERAGQNRVTITGDRDDDTDD